MTGITAGTTRAHVVRAALEAIAHQVADVLAVLPEQPDVLRVDGGATANRFLMQHQSDLLGIPVEVAAEAETTALGAAALAARTGCARARGGGVRAPPFRGRGVARVARRVEIRGFEPIVELNRKFLGREGILRHHPLS